MTNLVSKLRLGSRDKPHIYKYLGKWFCRGQKCRHIATSPKFAYRGWLRKVAWIKHGLSMDAQENRT